MATANEPPAILVVDDNPQVLETYRKILGGDDSEQLPYLDELENALFGIEKNTLSPHQAFRIDMATDGRTGCGKVEQACREGHPYAVAFVDMRMPGGWNGLETVEALWGIDPDVQVVICTAYTDFSWEEITARLGCSDKLLILRKPFEKIEVFQLACALSDKWRLERERQAQYRELEQRVVERTRQVLLEREAYEAQLYHSATHDSLTGLPNRALLMDRLCQALNQARRSGQRLLVALIDLDRFKWVNDSLGHDEGDKLLKTVAARLCAELRESDTLARLGGDEFVLVWSDCGGTEAVTRVLERLIASIAEPIKLGNTEASITCSLGCSAYPEDGEDAAALLRFADAAMYRAKEKGRNGVQLYNDELRAHIEERLRIETELRLALNRDELMLYYQPQVDLHSGRIVGLEALLRWRHPELGMIPPARFVPVAEESGLIGPITEWVLQRACRQGTAWRQAGLPPLCIAVNISARQLGDVAFPALVARCLEATGFDPTCLELELTESAAMENPDHTIPLMHLLKSLGVSLSIDDFGTGYSNMHYLKRFPVDKLKLDGSFVRDITRDSRDLAIVGAIIAMAQQLGLRVIGEMAETEGQVVSLARQGCDEVQGYYFSASLPVEDCEKLLRQAALPLPLALERGEYLRRLLVLSDDARLVAQIEGELQCEGFHLFISGVAEEAFELLARHRVGVVLCDQRFNQACGVDFLHSIKHTYPDTVRLMFSREQDFNTIAAAVNFGAVYKFLTVPWAREDLVNILDEAFRLYEKKRPVNMDNKT